MNRHFELVLNFIGYVDIFLNYITITTEYNISNTGEWPGIRTVPTIEILYRM